MVNEKKINELEQKLAQLDKDYSDLGAYKEYGSVMREMLDIMKSEFSTSEKRMTSKESEIDEKQKYKSGTLMVQLGHENSTDPGFTPDYFLDQEVEIKFNDNSIYLQTYLGWAGLTEPVKENYQAICKRKLLGGNYVVKATVGKESIIKNITVDDDTYVYFKFKRL